MALIDPGDCHAFAIAFHLELKIEDCQLRTLLGL